MDAFTIGQFSHAAERLRPVAGSPPYDEVRSIRNFPADQTNFFLVQVASLPAADVHEIPRSDAEHNPT